MKNNSAHSRVYRRNLPHIQPEDGTFFITYNLDGVLPNQVIKELQEKRDLKIEELKNQGLAPEEIKHAIRQIQDLYFGKFDSLLDNPSSGPKYLAQPEIAEIVIQSLHWLDGRAFRLICFTIMCNHVHLVVDKIQEKLWVTMKRHKTFTGNIINKMLGREGQFWHRESFDHLIRDQDWMVQKIHYTLENAKKAKIVKHWREFPYSWIAPEFEHLAPE